MLLTVCYLKIILAYLLQKQLSKKLLLSISKQLEEHNKSYTFAITA